MRGHLISFAYKYRAPFRMAARDGQRGTGMRSGEMMRSNISTR